MKQGVIYNQPEGTKRSVYMEQKEFYMVFLEGQQTPTYKHETLESATKEAKRLTEMKGLKSYVLGTITSFKIPEKFVEEKCTVEELPF